MNVRAISNIVKKHKHNTIVYSHFSFLVAFSYRDCKIKIPTLYLLLSENCFKHYCLHCIICTMNKREDISGFYEHIEYGSEKDSGRQASY